MDSVSKWNVWGRNKYDRYHQKKLKNKDITLIANDCTGGIILHELGLEFKSPFVNLWMKPSDYVKLLENLASYMTYNLEFITEEGIDYPIGYIDGMKIYFQHYKSTEEALDKWNERKKRMNYDKMFVLFSDRNGCTYDEMIRFDALPFSNKVMFVSKKYNEFESAYYLKGLKKTYSKGTILDFKNYFSWKKWYDDFDYIAWFNGEK